MRQKLNLYGLGKAILSSAMIVGDWWKKPYNIQELADAFGVGALQRGIDQAEEAGETVPQEAKDALASVKK